MKDGVVVPDAAVAVALLSSILLLAHDAENPKRSLAMFTQSNNGTAIGLRFTVMDNRRFGHLGLKPLRRMSEEPTALLPTRLNG